MEPRSSQTYKWTQLELDSLVKDKDSCVHFQRVIKCIALMPCQLSNITKGVLDYLDECVNCYDIKSDGLILAYNNPMLASKFGIIKYDYPQIYIDIQVDLYLFKPEIGKSLKGLVKLCTKTSNILGIVYHVFNFYIPRPTAEQQNEWLGNNIKAEKEIKFTVEFLDLKRTLPYIQGTLHEEDSRESKSFDSKANVPEEQKQITDVESTSENQKNKKKKFNLRLKCLDKSTTNDKLISTISKENLPSSDLEKQELTNDENKFNQTPIENKTDNKTSIKIITHEMNVTGSQEKNNFLSNKKEKLTEVTKKEKTIDYEDLKQLSDHDNFETETKIEKLNDNNEEFEFKKPQGIPKKRKIKQKSCAKKISKEDEKKPRELIKIVKPMNHTSHEINLSNEAQSKKKRIVFDE